jgi:hypothetical protein
MSKSAATKEQAPLLTSARLMGNRLDRIDHTGGNEDGVIDATSLLDQQTFAPHQKYVAVLAGL